MSSGVCGTDRLVLKSPLKIKGLGLTGAASGGGPLSGSSVHSKTSKNTVCHLGLGRRKPSDWPQAAVRVKMTPS